MLKQPSNASGKERVVGLVKVDCRDDVSSEGPFSRPTHATGSNDAHSERPANPISKKLGHAPQTCPDDRPGQFSIPSHLHRGVPVDRNWRLSRTRILDAAKRGRPA